MTSETADSAPSNEPENERDEARELVRRALETPQPDGGTDAIKVGEKFVIDFLAKHGKTRIRPQQAAFRSNDEEELARNASTVRVANVKIEHRRRTIELRRMVAKWAIAFVLIQIVASNLFFGVYIFGNLKNVDATIMVAWMSSSVVEIIGIMGIVALSLFPNRNGRKSSTAKQALSVPEE